MRGIINKYIFYLLFTFPLSLHSQILNIDREGRDDSTFKSWMINGSFSLSSDKQKNNVLDVSTNIELNKNLRNNYSFIGIVRNDAVYYGKSSIQNEGQMQLRFRDLDKRKYSYEGYLQYQWNGAWGMEYRYVVGSNFRMKFFEEKKSDLYIGLGVFREWERWNWTGVNKVTIPDNPPLVNVDIYRLNTYSKYSIKLTDQVDISAISYIQLPLNQRFLYPRWYFESNLYFQATKHLNFIIHWDHIFDSNRYVPIDKFYYTFSTGIQLSF